MEVVGLGKGLSQQFITWLRSESKTLRWLLSKDEKNLSGGSCHTLGLDMRVRTPSMSQKKRIKQVERVHPSSAELYGHIAMEGAQFNRRN
jgi:hypothetical protein